MKLFEPPEMFWTTISIRYALIALGVIVLTWSATLLGIRQDYQHRIESGIQRASEISVFFERDARQILVGADGLVQEARRLIQYTDGLEAVRADLTEEIASNEFVSHLTVLDEHGKPQFITGHTLNRNLSAADRDYFQFQKRATGDEAYISLPHLGRNTGKLTVRLVRRLTKPDGSFGGVIFAAIPEEQFTAFYDALNLGSKSSATVVGLDKKLRARSSYGRLGPGQDISGSVLWKNLMNAKAGTYSQLSVVDDVQRFYAYRAVEGYPLVVAMGLAEEDVVRGSRQFSRPVMTVAVLTTVTTLLLTVLLSKSAFMRKRLEREVQERKQIEKGLETANNDLVQFAYSASHDLKSPLATIGGLLELCSDDIEDEDYSELQKHVGMAKEVASSSAKKVESLLKIARTADGEVTYAEFQFQPLVETIWRDLTANMETPIVLDLELDHGDPINGSKEILHPVLQNLFSNALKYTDPEKDEVTIKLKTWNTTDGFAVSVTDNGIGITEEDQAQVFEMFSRMDNRSGDGLGLSLVQRHVARVGGQITLQSQKGVGTTFTVLMPTQGSQI